MHSKGKGISSSALPYKRSAPGWCKTTSAEVTEAICKLARKGMTPSQIGVYLRDSSGIPQVGRGLEVHGPGLHVPGGGEAVQPMEQMLNIYVFLFFSHRCAPSLAPRSCACSRATVWLLSCPRTCTT